MVGRQKTSGISALHTSHGGVYGKLGRFRSVIVNDDILMLPQEILGDWIQASLPLRYSARTTPHNWSRVSAGPFHIRLLRHVKA